MDIAATSFAPPAPIAATGAQTSSVLSSDFETFLKMLTAQARFQDPLEPIDNAEYAAQLAQFSLVEQQVLSNDLLTSLAQQLGSNTLLQVGGWIGMEALTTAPSYFSGTPIEFYPNPAAAAEEVFLVVRDDRGVEVQRIALSKSADPISWAGVRSNGSPFDPGIYSFEIESRAQGNIILSEPAETYSQITEARLQDNEAVLVLSGGVPVRVSEVSGLRDVP